MKTDSVPKMPQPGLDAAREDRSFFGYVNAKTGIDSETVLTDSTFIQLIGNGKRLVITSFYMRLTTVSDSARAELVTTANADGSGVITSHTGQFWLHTGAALAQQAPAWIRFDPPLIVSMADGQALTAQVLGNDADAALTVMIQGWEEDDHNRV